MVEILNISANSFNAFVCRELILNGLFDCGFFNAAIRSLAAITMASFDVIPVISQCLGYSLQLQHLGMNLL